MARTTPDPADEVLRTDFSGTIWFGATLIASAAILTGLLAGGWRPADLPPGAAVVWWIGSVLVLLGIAGLAWAGCPVESDSIRRDDRTKTLAIRIGLAAFGAGGIVSLLALLLSPAVAA